MRHAYEIERQASLFVRRGYEIWQFLAFASITRQVYVHNMDLPKDHGLSVLKTVHQTSNPKTIKTWLTGKTLAEIQELMDK